MAGLRRQVVQRLPGGTDDPGRQRRLAQSVQLSLQILELSLVLGGVGNLEGDDRRDGQLVALKRAVPVGRDRRVVSIAPDRRVEQVGPR
jgi:hypothetical protein